MEWLPVLVISKSLKELAILMRELVVIKAVFFSLFFPILLRTVVTYQNLFLWFFWELWLWMLRIALKTAWGLVSGNHPTLVIMGMNMFDDFWGIAKENWLHIGWHLLKSPYLDLGILKALKNQESFSCFFSFSEINLSSCRNLPRKTLVVIIFEVWELVGGNTYFDQNQKNCHSPLILKP
jgi:hypothetical protein